MSHESENDGPNHWPALPSTGVPEYCAEAWAKTGEIVRTFGAAQLLEQATMSVRDKEGQVWEVDIDGEQSSASSCRRLEVVEPSPFDWKLELLLCSPFPTESLRQLYQVFDGAEFHLPGMIIRDEHCYHYQSDRCVEVAIVLTK